MAAPSEPGVAENQLLAWTANASRFAVSNVIPKEKRIAPATMWMVLGDVSAFDPLTLVTLLIRLAMLTSLLLYDPRSLSGPGRFPVPKARIGSLFEARTPHSAVRRELPANGASQPGNALNSRRLAFVQAGLQPGS